MNFLLFSLIPLHYNDNCHKFYHLKYKKGLTYFLYNYIKNPKTGRKVDVYNKLGQSIIRNYLNQYGGHDGPCALGPKDRCRKSKQDDGNCYVADTGRCRKNNAQQPIPLSTPTAPASSGKHVMERTPTMDHVETIIPHIDIVPNNSKDNDDLLYSIMYSWYTNVRDGQIDHDDLEEDINEIMQTFRRYDYKIISSHENDLYLKDLKYRSEYLQKYLEM